MENSKKGITMAEKRVGEMNKLTQGLLEQSNRYFQQKNAPQQQNAARQNTSQQASPQRQNAPVGNVPFRNNQGAQNMPPKPRFETVGDSRRQKTQQQYAPPQAPEPQKPSKPPKQPSSGESFLPIKLDSDTALIAALAAVLVKENADTKLILALLYILL